MKHFLERDKRKKIGIICGSGPEAGIYLWNLIIKKTRILFGDKFEGDIDMPHVLIISDPRLGESMEIRDQTQKNRLWEYLDEDIRQIEGQVDYFVIACYTLHVFEPEIIAIPERKKIFVSLIQCLKEALQEIEEPRIALFHASVLSSEKCPLHLNIGHLKEIELPVNGSEMRDLILSVKNNGSDDKDYEEKFAALITACESDTVVLACTELPLINPLNSSKRYINCMDIVAERLVNNISVVSYTTNVI